MLGLRGPGDDPTLVSESLMWPDDDVLEMFFACWASEKFSWTPFCCATGLSPFRLSSMSVMTLSWELLDWSRAFGEDDAGSRSLRDQRCEWRWYRHLSLSAQWSSSSESSF